MSNLHHDFVTVDMRGLKAALVERARSERVSVSALVRRAVAYELERERPLLRSMPTSTAPRSVKVSIRLTGSEAERLRIRARADGTSMGSLLTALAAETPAPRSGANRPHVLAALVESSAGLSTLNRSVHHLTVLLRQGSSEAARQYRGMLETLADEVRRHLNLASSTLAELPPRRSIPGPNVPPIDWRDPDASTSLD